MTNEYALLEAQRRVDSFKPYADASDAVYSSIQQAELENAQRIALIAIDTEIEGYEGLTGVYKHETEVNEIFYSKLSDLQLIKDQIKNTL